MHIRNNYFNYMDYIYHHQVKQPIDPIFVYFNLQLAIGNIKECLKRNTPFQSIFAGVAILDKSHCRATYSCFSIIIDTLFNLIVAYVKIVIYNKMER